MQTAAKAAKHPGLWLALFNVTALQCGAVKPLGACMLRSGTVKHQQHTVRDRVICGMKADAADLLCR
jgi:hypothetical protein